MKHHKIITALAIVFFSINVNAQTINWSNIDKQNKHIINANFGLEYGMIYGLGYGYYIPSKFPVLLNIELSKPAGKIIFDDFKTKIGGKIRLHKINDFQFSANAYGIYRRYETDFVQLQNFGSEFSGIAGYYKPKWFASVKIGFDKAVVTHFKHSEAYKKNFRDVKNGWYEPATGGNFYYGLQAGISFKHSDVTLDFGKAIAQDFTTNPLLSFYAQIGYNLKF
jgi:hypothetical protein